MRKLIVMLTAVGFVMGVGETVHARGGYADAGCGLGAIVFGADNIWWKQVIAATLNGTGIQTFGITTGTSRCGAGISSGGPDLSKAFIESNCEASAKDAARAQGETITSLSQLAGCQDACAVGQTLQREFSSIFPNAELKDTEVSENVVQTLRSHNELGCQNLI